MSFTIPSIELAASMSTAGGPFPDDTVGAIGQSYAQLIAAGTNVFQGTGARLLHLDAGTISKASPAQIGRVIDGVTVTEDVVLENQRLLNALGAYCRANGIGVVMEIQGANAPAYDWTYQWLEPAVAAQLPIVAVENNTEPEVNNKPAEFDQLAEWSARIMKQVVRFYPNVKVGQWVGGNLTTAAAWWTAYDKAAAAHGLPTLSYATADTSWNTPWLTSPAAYQTWLADLSSLLDNRGMQLKVMIDGTNTDISALQWTAQAEQHMAMLAQMSNVEVDTLLVRSWQFSQPSAVLPLNDITTLGNVALNASRLYGLYQTGKIAAQGVAEISVRSQAVAAVNTPSSLGAISLKLVGTNSPNAMVALVIAAESGRLVAEQKGNGSVSGAGTNTLVLNGTVSDVNLMLATLSFTETSATLDTITFQAFGAQGRIGDGRMVVAAYAGPASGTAEDFVFASAGADGTPAHPWAGAAATVDKDGLILSTSLTWNRANPDPVTGAYAIVKQIASYQPLAESGNALVGGAVRNSNANVQGNAPLILPNWLTYTFDPSLEVSYLNVETTEMTFNAVTGALEVTTDTFAPSNPTGRISGGTLPNYLSLGGRQVTYENTGSNPYWRPEWGTQYRSVSIIYGSSGQVLEQVFQGDESNQYVTVYNVYNPYTGALWEQIRSSAAPGPYGYFVSGGKSIIQFNTGDNPNWHYADWGARGQVTVTWQDYYVVKIEETTPPLPPAMPPTPAPVATPTPAPVTDPVAPVASTPVVTQPSPITVVNTTQSAQVAAAPQPYRGPVAGLQHEYINITPDSLNITVQDENWFIHSGDGQDAIAVAGGTNVLDGGTGSNFLVGASGTDTFFIDARGAIRDIWSTVVNFHAGDFCTFWGIDPSFALEWQDGLGADGYTGVTLLASRANQPRASMTLTGFSKGDVDSGRLFWMFGQDPGSGSNYLCVGMNH